jgi:Ca2+-binding EF-hand superfamily protein
VDRRAQVALRRALGIDLPLSDCEQLVATADVDGTGTVDFDEFLAIVRRHI